MKRWKSQIYYLFISLLISTSILLYKTSFNYKEDFAGIFLLKGENGKWFELTDDLFPEEVDRIIGIFPFHFNRFNSQGQLKNSDGSLVKFEWNSKSGRGFIKNIYPDGRKLLICLGRFKDTEGQLIHGLFLGGNLPVGDSDSQIFNKDESGMAYFDGRRYYHIWCNANEGLVNVQKKEVIYPASWDFLGSSILEHGNNGITLQSKHRALINGSPIGIDRYLFYTAGKQYFNLVIKLTNLGKTPETAFYIYGDEPWLGNFGTSEGNIGWLKDRVVKTETFIDMKKNHFAGMFDYGNDLIGERPGNYTNKSNFIEWDKSSVPNLGYFANREGGVGFMNGTPLSNRETRFIGLQWGPRTLKPGETYSIIMSIGMADYNPETKLPVKPPTSLQ